MSYAPSLSLHGAGGIRTPTSRLKRPMCRLYTTTPDHVGHTGVYICRESSWHLQISRDGRIRTGVLLLPRQADCAGFPTSRSHFDSQGGRIRTGVLELPELADSPGFPTPCTSSPCGGRTHLSALKGRYPAPLDEQAKRSRVGQGALESPSAGLQPAAKPSQLPAHVHKKSPVFGDTGP